MDEISELVKSHKDRGVLVDSNLLLVYFIGVFDPERLTKFKRTAAFSTDDFYLLAQLLHFLGQIVTTPNILTEVNGLSNQLPDVFKSDYYEAFAKQIVIVDEHYIPSKQISLLTSFARLGLTDLGIAAFKKVGKDLGILK